MSAGPVLRGLEGAQPGQSRPADRRPISTPRTCRPCPARSRCTRAKQFRRKLRFGPRAQHEALQTARTQHASGAGHRLYTKRAGIEGPLSQGVRAFALRRTRYLGHAKTHLQPIATAAAMNIDRLVNWLDEMRPAQICISRFKALAG